MSYTITFQAGRYYVAPGESTQKVTYFSIIDAETRQPVAYAFAENFAKTICLALELVNARISGDATQERELSRLIDQLKN